MRLAFLGTPDFAVTALDAIVRASQTGQRQKVTL